ncbi:MAG TPA: helicase C-terminal domain-containing protein [Candidatus Limnocylindria bacterium]|nr:helicase C-terminal domain-containing protein [Candidatus Limnocylindria bacterium]
MSLRERVEKLFASGGPVAARWRRYEDRVAQQRLAAEVADAFDRGGVLLAEAPTGVGKSLGYLLPAVLAAHDTDRRVVIATCTKSLQDQLFERELPAVLEVLGVSLPCARLKGKQNYLCPRALEVAEGRGEEETETLDALRSWQDEEGDLDRFPADDPEAFRRVRGRVASDPNACAGVVCRRGRECYWVRARRRASECRLLIVNHALLALAGEAEGLLPDFDLLVVDEAHRLEGVLLAQLERSLSRNRFEEALRPLGARRRGRESGLSARMRSLLMPLFDAETRAETESELERLAARSEVLHADLEQFFAAVEPRGARHELYGARERYRSAAELFGRDLQPLEALLGHCSWVSGSLLRLAARALDPDQRRRPGLAPGERLEPAEELASELERAAAQWSALGRDVEELGEAAMRDWVYWRTASSRGVELHGAPVWVGDHARRLVLGRAAATVLTSATLSTGGDFRFTAERLGLEDGRPESYRAVAYASPFALAEQMRTFVYGGASGDEAREVAEVVRALALHTGRNLLVLLTAHERLRRVRALLLESLPPGRVLLAQEWDGSASLVSERFRAQRGAVLLGVQSLWEGVDFPGEALEILVVAKLPFSVPDDPLVEARGERLRERGLDAFRHDAIPEAVLRFRQGIGRLIRRADDRGVLVVCDPRLVTASYRRAFLAALPGEPHVVRDPEALADAAETFLAAPGERRVAPSMVEEEEV